MAELNLNVNFDVLDPVLFQRLNELNDQADRIEEQGPDRLLSEQNWQTLQENHLVDSASISFLIDQYQYQASLWDTFTDSDRPYIAQSLQEAYRGKFEKAHSEFSMFTTGSFLSASARTFLLEKLVWLDLFYGSELFLSSDLDRLNADDSQHPVLCYAQAIRAYQKLDFETTSQQLAFVESSPSASPVLRAEARILQSRIDAFDPALDRQNPVSLPEVYTKNHWRAYENFANYCVLTENYQLADYFDGQLPDTYEAFKANIVKKHKDGIFSDEDVAWIIHLFFNSPDQMTYVVSSEPRDLGVSFQTHEFDCTEYTNGATDILSACGIKSRKVYMQTAGDFGHMFAAYQIDGKWGYMSVRSFSEPIYDDYSDLLDQWKPRQFPGTSFTTIEQASANND